MYIEKAIPKTDFPSLGQLKNYCEEDFISISEYFEGAILIEPVYFNKNLFGSTDNCYVRLGVAKMLKKALEHLPKQLTFKVYDAWRPVTVQQSLYDSYYKIVAGIHQDWAKSDIEFETKKFVSAPSYDIENPSVHTTGGAIDLTICNISDGSELDMGTAFDDFSPKTNTAFFENHVNEEVRNNRRLLYWAMISAGFTNLPTEWWHYDYGDSFWSFFTGKPAIYKGLLRRN